MDWNKRQYKIKNMNQYSPKLYDFSRRNIKVKLDLYNYAINAGLKGETGFDISNLAAKSDLASLKAQDNKINVDKLKTGPADLSKTSDAVDNNIVTKRCVTVSYKIIQIYQVLVD